MNTMEPKLQPGADSKEETQIAAPVIPIMYYVQPGSDMRDLGSDAEEALTVAISSCLT